MTVKATPAVVLEYVIAEPGITAKRIADYLGQRSAVGVSRSMKKLMEDDLVECHDNGWHPVPNEEAQYLYVAARTLKRYYRQVEDETMCHLMEAEEFRFRRRMELELRAKANGDGDR